MRPSALRSRRVRSTLASSAVLLAVAVGAAACGDSDGGGSDNGDNDTRESNSVTSGTLSADQVTEAVVPIDTLGAGWKDEPVDDDDDDEDGPGCFGEIARSTDDLDETEKAEKKYGYGDQGMPQINTEVSTYDDTDTVADLFDEVEKKAAACTGINYTEGEWTYDLSMRTMPDVAIDSDIDDQFSFVVSGTLTSGSQTADMYLYYTMVRVGPSVASLGTTGLTDVADLQEQLVKAGAARLSAVAAGEEPEPATISAP